MPLAAAPTTSSTSPATTQAPTTTTTVATTTSTMASTTTTSATTATTEAPTTAIDNLVKVPSYTDFKGSYEGDDFGEAVESWQDAVEEGFRRVGPVADVELVPPGEQEHQKPKAGSMVPKGTLVHIRVAVYD